MRNQLRAFVDRRHAGLALLLAAAPLAARAPVAERMSDPRTRAFVSSVLPLGDHGVLAYYGGDAEHNVVHLQRLDSTLSVYGRPVVLTDAQRDAYEPRLASIGHDVLVTWYEKDPQAGAFSAQMARIDWSGHAKWHRRLSHDGHAGRSPVACTTADGAWVAWLETDDTGGTAVWVEHLSEDGLPVAPAQRAGAADAATANLNAAVDAADTFYVVFDANLPGGARGLQLVTASAGGVTQRALGVDDGRPAAFPDIAIEGTRVALCWTGGAESPQVRLAVGALADLGPSLSGRAVVVNRGAGPVGGSYLAWNRDQLAVAWNVTGHESGVFLQRFDARGRAQGSALRVARTNAPALPSVPVVAAWRRGYTLAWDEYGEDAGTHRVTSAFAWRVNLD